MWHMLLLNQFEGKGNWGWEQGTHFPYGSTHQGLCDAETHSAMFLAVCFHFTFERALNERIALRELGTSSCPETVIHDDVYSKKE